MGKIQVTAVDPLQEKLNQKVRLAANLMADSNRSANEIASYDSSQKHNRQVSVKTCRLCCGVMRQKRYFFKCAAAQRFAESAAIKNAGRIWT